MSISREQQLKILKKMKDEEIDYSDAPSATKDQLASLKMFIPPEKRTITINLDVDVLNWFKEQQSKGYQTFINAVLREFVSSKDQKTNE
jgi:uncharacterized protein (DUF4415 family)